MSSWNGMYRWQSPELILLQIFALSNAGFRRKHRTFYFTSFFILNEDFQTSKTTKAVWKNCSISKTINVFVKQIILIYLKRCSVYKIWNTPLLYESVFLAEQSCEKIYQKKIHPIWIWMNFKSYYLRRLTAPKLHYLDYIN